MTDLTTFFKTDDVDDILAILYNDLVRNSLLGELGNSESLTSNKTLTDDDSALQVYAPTAARDVTLPAVGAKNHVFYIINTSASYALTVKNAGGTVIAQVWPLTSAITVSDSTAWYAITRDGLPESGGPTWLTLGAIADGQALKRSGTTVVGVSDFAGRIHGLQMVWVSTTALTVKAGEAYIPALGRVYSAPSDIAKTGLSLSNSTWYHVYLYDNSGTPDVEIVTTAPDTAYIGSARAKTGDTSRRYVGSVLTNASGQLQKFLHLPETGQIVWLEAINNTPFRVLVDGTQTSATAISVAGCTPSTATTCALLLINGSTYYVFVSNSSGGYYFAVPPAPSGTQSRLTVSNIPIISQNIYYLVLAGGTFSFIDVSGYNYER